MPKDNQAPVLESQASPVLAPATESPVLAPATYTLVGFADGVRRTHIPSLNREYDLEELAKRPDILELLASQGWEHVVKTR